MRHEMYVQAVCFRRYVIFDIGMDGREINSCGVIFL